MINPLKNERGYSLLLVIAVIMIFAVLGLSLMTLTTNGIAKNQIRENTVQASDLANKGIDFLIKDIQLELENFIKSGNVGKNEFKNKLITLIQSNNLGCRTGGVEIPGDTGKTTVCIDVDKIEDVYLTKADGTKELQEFKKNIPIISKGFVNGKEKTTTAKVIIGTDAIPDQLKYALSTNEGGNLYFHGGVEIQGDVKTDGNLVISNQATYVKNTYLWEDSVPARIIRDSKSITPKIIINENKNVYVLKNKNVGYDNHISGTYLNNTTYYEKISPAITNASATISSKFFSSPNLQVVKKETLPDDKVEVKNTIEKQYNMATKRFTTNYQANTLSYSISGSPSSYKKDTTIFIGNYTSTRFCDGTEFWGSCWGTWVGPGFYGGNFTINSSNKDLNLKGTYFVNGNLNITNTKLKSDALIYVKGNVTIRESTLSGIDNNSTLIIFAEGDISISNISEYSNTPSIIKGFFYTKSNMIMYGVGSNINIYGGLSSKRLILTALRGTSKDKNGFVDPSPLGTQQAVDSSGNPTAFSRLKVIYDQNLITQYTEFKRDQEEEFITELNTPEIIERFN